MATLSLPEESARAGEGTRDRTQHVDNIMTFAAVLVTGFIVAWIYHYFRGYHLNRMFPDNSFLFVPVDGGGDFFRSLSAIRSDVVYDVPETFYFPFTYVVLRPLRLLSDRTAQAVLLVTFASVALWFVWRQLEQLRPAQRLLVTVITVGLNYSFLFALDRSNLECLVFVFLALHILALQKDRRVASAIFLAAATAMKLYPGVFVVLFLARRWYREFALTAGLSLLFVLASAAVIEGGVFGSLSALSDQLGTTLRDRYLLGDAGLKFSSGLYTAFRLVLIRLGLDTRPLVGAIQLPYTLFGVAVGAAVAWYVLRVEHELWKQVALLTLVFILLPQVSYDYRLIHLLLPLGLFFASGFHRAESPIWARAYVVLFALPFIPKAYYVFEVPEGRDFGLFSDINIGVFLNPLTMLLLATVLVVQRLRSRPRPLRSAPRDPQALTTARSSPAGRDATP